MEGYSISRTNARLLADVWSYMEHSGDKMTIEVRDMPPRDGRSLLMTLAQNRYAEDIHRVFNVSCDSREVCHLCDVRNVYISEADHPSELVVESSGASISFRVRDE